MQLFIQKTVLCLLFCYFCANYLSAQDTLKIDLSQFIEMGLQNSGQLKFERRAVDFAENRIDEAKANRFLPSFDLRTLHGLVPGVKSDSILPSGRPLPRNALFLDPNLENDFNDLGIFTRVDVNAVQPIYTWGAIKNAVSAARSGAIAAEHQLNSKKSGMELQLFELYFSYLLALETERILQDAKNEIRRVGDALKEMRDEGDPDFEEADMFKFEIFESEFEIQRMEVEQGKDFVKRVWEYALGDNRVVYEPENNFLDPVPFDIMDFEDYKRIAFEKRPELLGVEAGMDATKSAFEARKAQNLPIIFLGLNVSYATTPNRPRQSNPFIVNNTNFFSAAFGFGVRQNLNFLQIRSEVDKSRLEYKRMEDLRYAVSDGIILELNKAYREAVIAETKLKQIEIALSITRNWVRHEQLNYDIGFGNPDNLIESIQKELELRVELKQSVFELNKKVAELYKASGMPITQLNLE
ncbi:MAG: TolC family protein [Balneolaceae bacterium]